MHIDENGTLVRIRHFGFSEPAVKMHCLCWRNWGPPKLKAVAEEREPGATCLSEIADWREQHAYSVAAAHENEIGGVVRATRVRAAEQSAMGVPIKAGARAVERPMKKEPKLAMLKEEK
jgi:hypothetical protein